jgi:FkbM family methyltransferase
VELRRIVKGALVDAGLYEHFEYSLLHRAYLRVAHAEFEGDRRRRREQHRSLLRPGSLVFDVGANVGEMSHCYLALGCRVVAVEPDERCVRILQRRFGGHPRFALEAVAVSDAPGTATFHVQDRGSAYNTLSAKWRTILESSGSAHAPGGMPFAATCTVNVVTLDDLIARHGAPNYLKLDVEGHEVSALRGLSNWVDLVMFEANLPELRDETLECADRLQAIEPAARFQIVPNGAPIREDGWIDGRGLPAALSRTSSRSLDVYCKMHG